MLLSMMDNNLNSKDIIPYLYGGAAGYRSEGTTPRVDLARPGRGDSESASVAEHRSQLDIGHA
jgi:hypothetical protein